MKTLVLLLLVTALAAEDRCLYNGSLTTPVLIDRFSHTSDGPFSCTALALKEPLLTFTLTRYLVCGVIRLDLNTGKVTYPPGANLDEQALRWWDAVERLCPRNK